MLGPVAELADAHALGACLSGCGFDSHRGHKQSWYGSLIWLKHHPVTVEDVGSSPIRIANNIFVRVRVLVNSSVS